MTPARRRRTRVTRELARNHRAAVRAPHTTAQEGTMSDQLSAAQNSGFDPYAHAAAKREAAQGREIAQAARETELIDQLADQVAKQIHRACPNACAYEAAGAAMSVLVPMIAERDAALARLRDHLLAEADRLDSEPWAPFRTSESVARTLRKIVEETR